MNTPIHSLLADWVQAESSVISEHSSNFARDFGRLAQRARERARELGIEWDDDILPDYVKEHDA